MKTKEINNSLLYEVITEHLLKDEKPSEYLNILSERDEFNEYPGKVI